jgi:transcription initiation factor TFIID TATA-box-binding protein
LKIQNITATADLGQTIDIQRFNEFSWGKYSLTLYSGKCGYIKDESIVGRVTVFRTGKMISIGAKSFSGALFQLKHGSDLLFENGFAKPVEIIQKIRNIVATEDLKRGIKLDNLSQFLSHSMYEPEIFAGLIYKSPHSTTCLIFASGKMVITGAKNEKDIAITIRELKKKLTSGNLFLKKLRPTGPNS